MEAALHDILINTYNPNHDLRVKAEQALQQFLVTQGSLTALINFIGSTAVHRELRQAASLVLKNRLRDYFCDNTKPQDKGLPSSPEEKEYVKHQMLNILLGELDNSIRGILAEGIRVVSEFEFPDRWPNLVPTIIANIQNTDVLRIYNALLALRKLAKRYEYKPKNEREPFNHMLQISLPVLQQLMTQIITHNSIEAAQVMRLCFKVFWSATVYILPNVTGVDVNLWFNMIAEVMNKRLPEASEGIEPVGQPVNVSDRKTWPWWKLKKWTSRIMTHFLQRYGNPRYCNEEDKPFANFFRDNTSIVLLGPAMNNLQMKAHGQFLTDDVHRSCLAYLNNCCEMSPPYKVMKPHLNFILFEAVFPALCLTKDEVELFNDDPQEFIRKVHNPVSDWLSPMVAATTLLQTLARYRQKDVLPVFLPFLQKTLEDYLQSPPDKRDYFKKDGVLVAIATLTKIMLDSPQYKSMLIPFLHNHVLPEFQSPVAFIRARACWVIEYFSGLEWEQEAEEHRGHLPIVKKKKGKKQEKQMTAGEILKAVLNGLVTSLRDPSLPVQAAAACSIQVLIEKEGATELLRPLLPQIISEYFRIMEEVDNESVLLALQGIVQQYGDEIAGLAPTMIDHLVRKFNEYAQETEDEEAAYNATQCLDTIDSILECLEEQEQVLATIEPILLPLLLSLLTNENDCFEYIDSAVHMISCYTYYYEGISMPMWQVCGPLITALNEWAIDYISEIMVPILNFMTKGINIFINADYNGKKILNILLEALAKVYDNSEGYSGRDYNSASNLLSCLIIACKEGNTNHQLNPYLPSILSLVLEKLTVVKLKSVRIRLLEIIMAAFYYDAAYTLQIILSINSSNIHLKLSQAQNKPIEEFQLQGSITSLLFYFQILFESLKDMERDFTERLIVLSFLSILSLPSNNLPEIIRINLPSMFQQIIREIIIIEEEAKKQAEADDDDEDEDDDEDGDEDDEDYADGFDVDGLPVEKSKSGGGSKKVGGKSKDSSLRHVDDDDEDDDDFDDADPLQANRNRQTKLFVPEGGYDEEEDCINCEDEEYRQVLENLNEEDRIKRQLFMAGEPVDDEDEDDFVYTSPIENIPMSQFFVNIMKELSHRDQQQQSNYLDFLKQALNEEDHGRFNQIIQFAQEQEQILAQAAQLSPQQRR